MSPRPFEPPWVAPEIHGLTLWALEPYFGGSHRSFLEGLQRYSVHDVSLHVLPGRHWKWRMHGGSAALAALSQAAAMEGAPHLLFASSMLDLPAYRALAHPSVVRAPAILYMHENQLTYPLPPGVERDLGLGMKQLLSAGAADAVWFNSEFHRGEFLVAAAELLESMPDERPHWLLEKVEESARVVPVGCDLRRFDRQPGAMGAGRSDPGRWGDPGRGPLVVWNQRWEYDKAPGDLFRALYALQEEGVAFRVALAGSNQGLPTAEFVEARSRLSDHVVQWGRLDDPEAYADLLRSSDVVVSTALHEFFGVAVVEALYCGCRPVLPDRLSYPDIIPREVHHRVLYQEGGLVGMLRMAIAEAPAFRRRGSAQWETHGADVSVDLWSPDWQRTWVTPYDWGHLAPRYDREIWERWDIGARTPYR